MSKTPKINLNYSYETGPTCISVLSKHEIVTDDDIIELIVGDVEPEDGYIPETFEIAISFINNITNSGIDIIVNCTPNSIKKNTIKKIIDCTAVAKIANTSTVFIHCTVKAKIALKIYDKD